MDRQIISEEISEMLLMSCSKQAYLLPYSLTE